MLFDDPACFRLDRIPVRPGRLSRFWIQGAVGVGFSPPWTVQGGETPPLPPKSGGTPFDSSTGCGGRTWPAATQPFGVVGRRVREDGQAFGQWSDPALPHGAR
jgi:hypothetical protein